MLSECDRRDRSGGVPADATDRAQFLDCLRYLATEPRFDFARTVAKHSRAAVVAETGPCGQNLVLSGPGERAHRRKAAQEVLVILQHHFHPGLLQHHFGYPDPPGVVRDSPRQRSLMPDKPFFNCGSEAAGGLWQ